MIGCLRWCHLVEYDKRWSDLVEYHWSVWPHKKRRYSSWNIHSRRFNPSSIVITIFKRLVVRQKHTRWSKAHHRYPILFCSCHIKFAFGLWERSRCWTVIIFFCYITTNNKNLHRQWQLEKGTKARTWQRYKITGIILLDWTSATNSIIFSSAINVLSLSGIEPTSLDTSMSAMYNIHILWFWRCQED